MYISNLVNLENIYTQSFIYQKTLNLLCQNYQPQQTNKQTNKQTSKQTSKQTNKQANTMITDCIYRQHVSVLMNLFMTRAIS